MPKIHGDLEYQASTRAVLSGTGTALLPGITFSGDLNTGIYRPGADQIGFSTGGSVRLIINDEGALVISDTTAPGTTTNKLYSVSGNLYWNGVQIDAGGSYLQNVVEDTTPQLGGNLDVNGFDIVTTSSNILDITGYANTGGVGGGVAITGGSSTTSTGGSASVAGGQGTAGATATLRGGTGTTTTGGQAQLAGGDGPTGGGRVRIQVGRDTTDGSADGTLDLEKPSGTTAPEFHLHEAGTNGTNYIGLKAPDSVTADRIWVLPVADPSTVSGQFIATDASGNLYFAPGTDLVNDTTPQLGGNLDVQSYIINTSIVNGDITITPNGTGNIVLDGLSWPNADGTANQILTTDGLGALSWADAGSGAVTSNIYTATSGQTSFSGNDDNGDGFSYIAGSLDVHLNGVLLISGTDYTATNGTSVVLTVGATAGDKVQMTAYQGAMGTSTPEFVYTATASQTTFTGVDDNGQTLSYAAGEVYVYKNGVLFLDGTDYTATNGTSVVLTVPATLNDTIQIVAPLIFTVSSAYTKAEADAKYGILAETNTWTDVNTYNASITMGNNAQFLGDPDVDPAYALNGYATTGWGDGGFAGARIKWQIGGSEVMRLRTTENNSYAAFRTIDGSAATPGFGFNSYQSTGMFVPSSTTIGFTAAGTEVFRGIQSGGSDVNYIELWGSVTGVNTLIRPGGTDTNIDLQLTGKGSGQLKLAAEKWPSGAPTLEGEYLLDNGSDELVWSGAASHHKNMCINGGFEVWQEGVDWPAIGLSQYPCDMWQMLKASTTAVIRALRSATGRKGEGYCLRFIVTTADTSVGAADHIGFQHRMEGYDFQKLYGGPFTISFWVYDSASRTYGLNCNPQGGPPAHSYVTTFTTAAAQWKKIVITVPHSATPAWNFDNGEGLRTRITLMGGSNLQTATTESWISGNYYTTSAQSNFASSTSNTIYFDEFQIEAGEVATEFEQRTFQQELAMCQRYWESSFDYGTKPAEGVGASSELPTAPALNSVAWYGGGIPFKVQKRNTPTMYLYRDNNSTTAGTWSVYTGTWTTPTTATGTYKITRKGFVPVQTSGATLTGGNAYLIGGNWVANARL